jgi:integrase
MQREEEEEKPPISSRILEDATTKEDPNFDRKLDLVTAGARSYVREHMLTKITPVNCQLIISYILAMQTESSTLSTAYRITIVSKLVHLAEFHHPKSFRDMTRDDITLFLDRLRKSEAADPLHKWKGSYNHDLTLLIRFFKWLYYPDKPARQRIKKPDVIKNIAQQNRREITTYKPTDLWTEADDLLFCKYCPSKRDRAYHMVARDTAIRPGGLLNLKIKDIVWKNTDSYQVGEITTRDKTGVNTLPLIQSVPWLKDWLANGHPFPLVPDAIVFCGSGKKNTGRKLQKGTLNVIYNNYQKVIFPRLSQDPSVPPEDKARIEELIKTRKWTPYTRRHTAITEKSQTLSTPMLHQYAGWTPGSKMSAKYIHYFGNEVSNKLLEAAGIKPESGSENNKKGILKPKVCDNCKTANKPDAKICSNGKCRMILSYDAYLEKEQEHTQVKKEMEELRAEQARMKETMYGVIFSFMHGSDGSSSKSSKLKV